MTNSTIPNTFLEQGREFLAAIVEWAGNLPSIRWNDLAGEAAQGRVALFCIDMINGFCHEGALSSPRVQGIIPAVVGAFKGAYAIGVRNFILAQDCHSPESVEFADFPSHCLAGTSEAENIPELASLPFADLYTVVTKNSLNVFQGTQLSAWLEAHRDLSTAVIIGDCTDLCVYQAAMHLKLYANEHNLKMRVVVPENAVQTYDISVAESQRIGAFPHSGDVLHWLFLHHMHLNGIEVVHFSDNTCKEPERSDQQEKAAKVMGL